MGLQHNANVILVAGDPKPRQYFNPRRMQGKQEKWRRKYTGPFLVVKTIGPVNVTEKQAQSSILCPHR